MLGLERELYIQDSTGADIALGVNMPVGGAKPNIYINPFSDRVKSGIALNTSNLGDYPSGTVYASVNYSKAVNNNLYRSSRLDRIVDFAYRHKKALAGALVGGTALLGFLELVSFSPPYAWRIEPVMSIGGGSRYVLNELLYPVSHIFGEGVKRPLVNSSPEESLSFIRDHVARENSISNVRGLLNILYRAGVSYGTGFGLAGAVKGIQHLYKRGKK